jgi:hypothetical protein
MRAFTVERVAEILHIGRDIFGYDPDSPRPLSLG